VLTDRQINTQTDTTENNTVDAATARVAKYKANVDFFILLVKFTPCCISVLLFLLPFFERVCVLLALLQQRQRSACLVYTQDVYTVVTVQCTVYSDVCEQILRDRRRPEGSKTRLVERVEDDTYARRSFNVVASSLFPGRRRRRRPQPRRQTAINDVVCVRDVQSREPASPSRPAAFEHAANGPAVTGVFSCA